jgi:hypothetical protein
MSYTIFQLSKKDLVSGKVYDPGWYRVRLDSFASNPSKNLESPSTNYVYQGTILFNADTGDKKYEDHPIQIMFNSKALGFTKGFLMGLGIKEEDITEDKRWTFENALGKEIDVMVENDTWDGRLVNRVNHKYRQPRS